MALTLFSRPATDVSAISLAVLGTHFETFVSRNTKHHGMLLNAAAADLTQPEDFQDALNSVRGQLDSISAQIDQNSTSLHNEVLSFAKTSIEKLQIAMSKVEDLAVFIRGDYDNRTIDEAAERDILARAVDAFDDLQKATEGGLKSIGDLHAKVRLRCLCVSSY